MGRVFERGRAALLAMLLGLGATPGLAASLDVCAPDSPVAVTSATLSVNWQSDYPEDHTPDTTYTLDAELTPKTAAGWAALGDIAPAALCRSIFGRVHLQGPGRDGLPGWDEADFCYTSLEPGSQIERTDTALRVRLRGRVTTGNASEVRVGLTPPATCRADLRLRIAAPRRVIIGFTPFPSTWKDGVVEWRLPPTPPPAAAAPRAGGAGPVDEAARQPPVEVYAVQLTPASVAADQSPRSWFATYSAWLDGARTMGRPLLTAWGGLILLAVLRRRTPDDDPWSESARRYAILGAALGASQPIFLLTLHVYGLVPKAARDALEQGLTHLGAGPGAYPVRLFTDLLTALVVVLAAAAAAYGLGQVFRRSGGDAPDLARTALHTSQPVLAAIAFGALFALLMKALDLALWPFANLKIAYEGPALIPSVLLGAAVVLAAAPLHRARPMRQILLALLLAATILFPLEPVVKGWDAAPPGALNAPWWGLSLSTALWRPLLALALLLQAIGLRRSAFADAEVPEAAPALLGLFALATLTLTANLLDIAALVAAWYAAQRLLFKASPTTAPPPLAAQPTPVPGAPPTAPPVNLAYQSDELRDQRQSQMMAVCGGLGWLALTGLYLASESRPDAVVAFTTASLMMQAVAAAAIGGLLLTRYFNYLRGESGVAKTLSILSALAIICCAAHFTRIVQARPVYGAASDPPATATLQAQLSAALSPAVYPALALAIVGAIAFDFAAARRAARAGETTGALKGTLSGGLLSALLGLVTAVVAAATPILAQPVTDALKKSFENARPGPSPDKAKAGETPPAAAPKT